MQATGGPKPAPKLPGSLADAPHARLVDPHRRGRRDHRLHRQGRARPGHQDRAPPGRRRGARGRARPASRWSPPTPADAERGLHRRQPVDAGQRHGDPPRRGAGARDPDRRGGAPARRAGRRSSAPPTAPCGRADGRALRYGELVADDHLARGGAAAIARSRTSGAFRIIGKSMPRVDIPAKVTGGAAYVQDLRLPGMVHARVVRPPSPARG